MRVLYFGTYSKGGGYPRNTVLMDALRDAGAEMTDVVKVTVYLSDFEHFSAFNEVYGRRFAEPRPARTSVACSLVKPDYLVEIDALAVIDR